MKYTYILILCLTSLTMQLRAQVLPSTNMWNTLAMVTTETSYDEFMGMETTKATPLPFVLKHQGETIEIKGYMIALDVKADQSHFMFSRYPQNMCFFCGKAGPESAMQVFMAEGETLNHTTDKILLKGTLSIQKGDPTGLIYTMTQSNFVQKID